MRKDKKKVKNYKNFVLVINSGCSIDMSFVDEIPGIGAILFICQLGTEGGNAFADVVSGKVTPSGKLTDTWAKKYADIPFHDEFSYLNGNVEEEYYKEGIYVGYRYFDSFGVEPRYPFGYGLSYTEFKYENIHSDCEKITITELESGKKIKCSVDVSNVGNFDGKEVIQLYVHDVIGTYMRPIRELKDYRKVLLKSGEKKTISFEIGYNELGYYKPTGEYFVEAGEFEIFIGTDCMAKEKVKLQVVQ